jgi:YVTN family beta-propeller protein
VANYGDGTVSVIDGNTNSVIANLTIGGRLFAVAVNPNTNKVYVANDDSNFVYIIDGNENIVTKMLKIFFTNIKFPKIFVNPNTNKVYIPLNDIKRIYSIDGNTNNIAIIPLDILEQLSEIAINVNRNEIYIANYRSGTVYVIDGNTNNIVAEIDVGVKKFPDVMSIDPITNKLYMVHSDPRSEGTVSVIDVQAKKSKNVPIANAAVKSGDEPVDISVNPNTNKIYVANYGSGTVSVIDGKTNSNATNIQIGAEPIAIAVNAKTNKIYVANNGSGTVSVINGETNRVIPEIKVGIYPRDIGINPVTNKIYVANYGSGTVSVIDGNIDKVIQNISVGDHPRALDVNAKTNKIYVANTGSNAVSVIDGNTDSVIAEIKLRQYPFFVSIDPNTNKVFVANIAHMSGSNYNTVDSTKNSTVSVIDGNIDKVIQNISVGDGPIALAVNLETALAYVTKLDNTVSIIDENLVNTVHGISEQPPTIALGEDLSAYPGEIKVNPNTNKIYVANYGSGTVSVIDGKTNSNATNIQVGTGPIGIAVNPTTNKIYVANHRSNAVSVIDGLINKVVAAIKFNITPENSGHIKCNDKEYPTNQYLYIPSNTNCIAYANRGFQFSSWIENLGHNSTRTISTSLIPDSPVNSIIRFFGFNQYDNSEALSITRHGSFTASFKELPAPVPPEYWIPLYGVIISSIVGTWLIPGIIGWVKSKKQAGRLHQFNQRITCLYRNGKLDQNDIEGLDNLKRDITDAYTNGKISEQHYTLLNKRIPTQENKAINNNKPSYMQERISKYQSQSITNDFVQSVKTDSNVDNLLYYENSQLGIKIQYPSEWNLHQKEHYPDHPSDIWTQVVGFSSGREIRTNSNLENVAIYVKSLHAKNISVDTYSNRQINRIRKKFSMNEASPIILAGSPGYKVSYIDKKGYDTIEVWAVQRNNVYTIKCIAKAQDYSFYLPIFQEIISSFQITK